MTRIRAALFDWRGTLVHDPPAEWWVTEALTRTGRSAPAEVVATICHDIEVAAALDEAIELERTIDTSVEALMVGDRASHDGGGVKAGIATLLVSPPATAHESNGLDRVVRLVG